jgi:hypothetical protein
MVLIGFAGAVRTKENAVRLEALKLLLAALLITTSPGLALAQLANLLASTTLRPCVPCTRKLLVSTPD